MLVQKCLFDQKTVIFFLFRKLLPFQIMSGRHSEWNLACKVYIGGLSEEANKYDLEDAFTKYGPIKNVWVARRPPGTFLF